MRIEPSRTDSSTTEFKFPELRLVVHENCEKQNDRKRNSEQPEQCASTETHVSLHVLMTAWITRCEGQSSTGEIAIGRWIRHPDRARNRATAASFCRRSDRRPALLPENRK